MIPLLQLGNIQLDPDSLLTGLYGLTGTIGRFLALAAEGILIVGVVGFVLYWFFLRKWLYFNIPVKIYEIVQGQIMFSYEDSGGFLVNTIGAGQVFKLMPTLRKWRKPIMIKPKLEEFQTTLKGKRYINYVRLGKDAYVPFVFDWNLEDKAIVKLAQKLDLDSIKNELTANYIKFREEGIWAKYGNQIIVIAFAVILSVFLFIVAKEFTRTAEIIASGNTALAKAIDDLGRQVVN